jgi:hypothetical protein
MWNSRARNENRARNTSHAPLMTHLATSGRSRWKSAVVLILATVFVGWLGFGGEKRLRYSEEVQLEKGQIIKIDRVIKASPLGEIGGPGGWEAKYNSVRVVDGAQDPPPIWESADGLVPMLLDRDSQSDQWFLVATFYTCEPWYRLGRPKLPYAEFRATDGGWQKVPLAPGLVGRASNVLTGIPAKNDDLVTLPEKRALNNNNKIGRSFLKIVDQWRTGC